MTTLNCAVCGVEIKEGQSAKTSEGQRICYACCAERDKQQMREDGQITLYLTGVAPLHSNRHSYVIDPKWKIGNWPGSLEFRPMGQSVKVGNHNLAGVRYDVWFIFEGWVWHGFSIGNNTELLHCKRTKQRDPYQPQPRKHYIGMAGLHGYMPNYYTVGETRGSVADDLGQLHELSERAIKQLRKDWYLELRLHDHGNEYCEIVECDCGGSVESHEDDPM